MPSTNVCEAHVCECQNCFESLLIREPVRKGDNILCPRCSKKTRVAGIVADIRYGNGTKTLEAESIPC